MEQRLAGDRAKLSATWFDNRYRNIIGLRPTGGYNSQYFNIGLTRARGLEAAADVAITPALRVSGGYTFTDSAIVQSTSNYSPVFAVGQWAFRRPRHAGFVGATFTRQRLTADVQGHLIGRFVDSDFSSLVPAITGNPGHTTWDAHASWRLRTGLTALVSVDNLTNRNYQEPLGYLALQRAAVEAVCEFPEHGGPLRRPGPSMLTRRGAADRGPYARSGRHARGTVRGRASGGLERSVHAGCHLRHRQHQCRSALETRRRRVVESDRARDCTA